jgi:hypothetical protein
MTGRPAMWEKIRSGVAVVVITALIWLAADQNVMEDQTFQVPVRLASEDVHRYVAFSDPPYQYTFNVTLHGRRRHLKDFADALGSKILFEAVLDPARETSLSPQVLESKEILSRIKPLADSGLKIASVEPAHVSAYIDEFETVPSVRVNPNYGDLKVGAEPSPAKVSVHLPRFAAKQLRNDPVARADAQQRILAARQPDGSFKVKIPLVLDALKDMDPGLPVKILPSGEVLISGQVQSLTETQRKGPVQITWSIPQQIQDEFRIIPDPAANFRPDVDVVGPKGMVDQLDARDIRGFVDVFTADVEKPGVKIRRQAQFVLPPGFTIALTSPPCEIAFELQPRAAGGASDK